MLVNNGARVNFSHTHLCARTQDWHMTDNRTGSHPQPIWRLNSISRARQTPDGTFGAFVLVCVQIEGMPHYDEQQVTFILDDPSRFSARILVILGTPSINRSHTNHEGIQNLTLPQLSGRLSMSPMSETHSIQSHCTMLGEGIKFPTDTAQNPTNLDEKILLTDKCLVPGFESIIVHG